MALAVRLANPQMFPPQVQLVKLQLHGLATESEYAGGWNWSFAANVQVWWEPLPDQSDTGGSGLSRFAPLVPPKCQ
jgi:hypothetical protein